MLQDHPILKCLPAVFAVKNEYQIFTAFDCAALVKVRVGGEEFYDDSNGILRSNSNIHHVSVPIELLDKEKEYTIIYNKIIERKPYFPTSEGEKTLTIPFRPVGKDDLNIYLISDTHNLVDEPIRCGEYFGDKLDLLVLNGDIPNHSGDIKYFDSIYEIAGAITRGQCPVIFARGNHDARGIHAEEFVHYTPNANGKTYYTFRLGSIWGLVLDCGEDKLDDNEEYGGTVCFHNFRLAETKFLKQVAVSEQYKAEGIKHRLVICHIPFTHRPAQQLFDIEDDIYCEWASILRDSIKPTLMLCGHLHAPQISPVGGRLDARGQACPLIAAGKPEKSKDAPAAYQGCAITLGDNQARVIFNHSSGSILLDETISLS